MADSIETFTVSADDIRYVGSGLQRPESILVEPAGDLWTSDARGGVSHIRPDGSVEFVAARFSADCPFDTDALTPNGLAFASNGDIYVADIGVNALYRMKRSGEAEVVLTEVNGEPLGPVNFPYRDHQQRLWISVSQKASSDPTPSMQSRDGYVVLLEPGHPPRVVAEGIGYTNEVRLDPEEKWLYVVQSFARNVVRFPISDDGSLGSREPFGPEDHGAIVDGICFDALGNLWGTHVAIDRIFVITPEGRMHYIMDDESSHEVGQKFMRAFESGDMGEAPLGELGGTIAPMTTSISFGGDDLKTVYVGCLSGERIASFRSPVAGAPMAHWRT